MPRSIRPPWAGPGPVLLAACAVVEPPPGGPVDLTPPYWWSCPRIRGHGSGRSRTLSFTFSEKMDRISAVTWLHLFPDQRIRQTKWHGRHRRRGPSGIPAAGRHRHRGGGGRRHAGRPQGGQPAEPTFPLATGDSIPTGASAGVLIIADSAVTNAVIELYDVPPDTLEYFQQPLLRRTVTDRREPTASTGCRSPADRGWHGRLPTRTTICGRRTRKPSVCCPIPCP